MHPACQHLVGSDAADCKAILFKVSDAAHCSDDGPANVSHHFLFPTSFSKNISGVSPCQERECEKM